MTSNNLSLTGIVAALTLAFVAGSFITSMVTDDTRIVEVEVVKEVQVKVTPQDCIDALDAAQEGFEFAAASSTALADFVPVMLDALDATIYLDVYGLRKASDDIEEITARADTINSGLAETSDRFLSAGETCRESVR